jgi:hypothetical protein
VRRVRTGATFVGLAALTAPWAWASWIIAAPAGGPVPAYAGAQGPSPATLPRPSGPPSLPGLPPTLPPPPLPPEPLPAGIPPGGAPGLPRPTRPGEGALREPVAVDPRTVWSEAGRAAASGPIAERYTLSVRSGAQALRREEYTLRLDWPAGRLHLELAALRVHALDGLFVVTHAEFPGRFYRQDYRPPLRARVLGERLPPLILPALSLAEWSDTGGPGPWPEFSVWVRSAVWTGARLDLRAAVPVYELEGVCEAGRLSATVDAGTGRLRRLVLPVRISGGPAEVLTLDLTVTPLEISALQGPVAPPPDLSGRELVWSLAELVAPRGAEGHGQRPAPER